MRAINDAMDVYVQIFENAVEGIFQTLPGGRYLLANPALARIYGYASPEALMWDLTDIANELYVDPARRDTFMEEIDANDVVHDFRSEIRCKDGTTKWISENARAVRDEHGALLYYEGFVVDITEQVSAEAARKELEAELRQAHKLTALGTIAGGIAHDFRSILSSVSGYAELAEERSGRGRDVRSCVAQIGKIAARGTDLVDRILSLSHESKGAREPVRLDLAIQEVVLMLRASLPPSIEIVEEIEYFERTVLADPCEVFRLIVNLCTNAFQAMGENGGKLRVGLRVVRVASGTDDACDGLCSGEYVKLTVSDSAGALDPNAHDLIFKPLATTRSESGGTGFGLAIVDGIVKGLDGCIRVTSEKDRLTCFDVYLPVSDAAFDAGILARLSGRIRQLFVIARAQPGTANG